MTADFDRYAHDYSDQVQRSIDFIGQDVDFFADIKARILLDLARAYLGPTDRLAAVDIGCGSGLTDRHLQGAFGSLTGVDVSHALVEEAARMNPWARYVPYDGSRLPWTEPRFDVGFAI